mmetsp:Transcript_120236/g.236288  ORF Transcript_120236/g.236288 Transcript_120236/m.236288 type:complete len:413 (+) Transcript_120236:404-1642(+)
MRSAPGMLAMASRACRLTAHKPSDAASPARTALDIAFQASLTCWTPAPWQSNIQQSISYLHCFNTLCNSAKALTKDGGVTTVNLIPALKMSKRRFSPLIMSSARRSAKSCPVRPVTRLSSRPAWTSSPLKLKWKCLTPSSTASGKILGKSLLALSSTLTPGLLKPGPPASNTGSSKYLGYEMSHAAIASSMRTVGPLSIRRPSFCFKPRRNRSSSRIPSESIASSSDKRAISNSTRVWTPRMYFLPSATTCSRTRKFQNGYPSRSTLTSSVVWRKPSWCGLEQKSLTRSSSPLLSKMFMLVSFGCRNLQFLPMDICRVWPVRTSNSAETYTRGQSSTAGSAKLAAQRGDPDSNRTPPDWAPVVSRRKRPYICEVWVNSSRDFVHELASNLSAKEFDSVSGVSGGIVFWQLCM